MSEQKPKTVTVESIEWHTYNGKEYPVGATYEIDEQLVDSVANQGKAIRVDRAEVAAKQTEDSEKARQASSHPVEPMTTHNTSMPVKPKK